MNSPELSPWEALAAYRNDFPEAWAAFDEWRCDAALRRQRLQLAHTPLSIGVMGQIKAGKSSFLNQLLFEGQPLLPEAVTPKTANLTRIRHGAVPSFTAYFYSAEAWALLETLAASDAVDAATVAAHELVTQALKHHGRNIGALLAQGKVERQARRIDELLGLLSDYVGAEGAYTPLVENSELTLPLPGLEGIEIVDTPGMNDPVVSRTDKTRRYMAQCDVVFFLSPASRFLDDNDQQLLSVQLPAKGVKRLILVAAQFDAAILDDGFNRASFTECENRLRQRLTDHARRVLEQLAVQREQRGYGEVAALLRGMGVPIFASTYAQAFATLPPNQLSGSQRHVFEQFSELASDSWQGRLPTTADWQRISGFAALAAALAEARSAKEAILAEQRARLEEELQRERQRCLAQWRDQASERLDYLRRHDLADLEAHAHQRRQRIQEIASALAVFVAQQVGKVREQAGRMQQQLAQQAARAAQLQERTGYETKSYSVKVSDAVWWNPFTWGDYHYESYSRTRTYQYLAVADAVENLRFFLASLERELLRPFEALISPMALSAGLRRELIGVLDTRRDDFDPRGLRALVETALARIHWPRIEVAAPDPAQALAGFASEVRSGSEQEALRERLRKVVSALQQELVANLERAVAQVCEQLEGLARGLETALARADAESLERLRAAIADKTNQIARLEKLIHLLDSMESSA